MSKKWAIYTFIVIVAGGFLAACILLGDALDKCTGF